jgi:hypothetical protein
VVFQNGAVYAVQLYMNVHSAYYILLYALGLSRRIILQVDRTWKRLQL